MNTVFNAYHDDLRVDISPHFDDGVAGGVVVHLGPIEGGISLHLSAETLTKLSKRWLHAVMAREEKGSTNAVW